MTGERPTSEQRTKLEALFDGCVTDNEIPIVAVATVDSDDIVYSEGFGTAGSNGDGVGLDTMFQMIRV